MIEDFFMVEATEERLNCPCRGRDCSRCCWGESFDDLAEHFEGIRNLFDDAEDVGWRISSQLETI
jgi:hypothetical protein